MKQIEPIKLLRIRESERGILSYLLEEHITKGSYFGNKNQHYKMCKELLDKLTSYRI